MSQVLKIKLSLYLTIIISLVLFNLTFPVFWNDFVKIFNKYGFISLPKIKERDFSLGLDLKGGVHLIYEADLSNISQGEREEAMEAVRDVIERRVNLFGVKEPQVRTAKVGDSHRLIVELAGIFDVNQALKLIGETPYLDFREEGENPEDPFTYKITPLNGRMLKKSNLVFSQTALGPEVELIFNDEGAKIFAELTKKNLGKRIAIFLDGLPISVPTVRDVITDGRAIITGNFTIQEAKTLMLRLNAGALPVPIKIISQANIGPSLGEVDLSRSLVAGFWGFIILTAFMIGYYRFLGLYAIISLLVYMAILFFIFKFLPVTLTLSGIAGFIMSLGMAVDANILIFERIKEELKKGKDLFEATEDGVFRAWQAIRDSNLTTLILGGILYTIGTGFVQGFALTLSLGILVSIFTAIFFTKNLILQTAQTRVGRLKILFMPFYVFKL